MSRGCTYPPTQSLRYPSHATRGTDITAVTLLDIPYPKCNNSIGNLCITFPISTSHFSIPSPHFPFYLSCYILCLSSWSSRAGQNAPKLAPHCHDAFFPQHMCAYRARRCHYDNGHDQPEGHEREGWRSSSEIFP